MGAGGGGLSPLALTTVWNVNRKSEIPERFMSFPMILSDHERQDAMKPVSLADPRSYHLNNSDQIRHGNASGKGRVCKGSGRSRPKRRSPRSMPQFWGYAKSTPFDVE